MSKSPVHTKYDTYDYACYEFDYQFLEEARQHARDINFQRSSSCSDEIRKKRLGGEKKSKKSWKNSLFSWWKIDRSNKPCSNPVDGPDISKPSKGYGSGPFCGTARGVDNELACMCLGQPNYPHQTNAYGPV